MTLYRHRAQLSFAEETTPGSTISAPAHFPGIASSIDLPDEVVEFRTYPAIGGGKDWTSVAEGPHSFEGGVDFTLVKGDILLYGLGDVSDIGTADGAGGSTLNGATAVGATTIILADATGYANGEFIQVDVTTKAEIREIASIAGAPTLTLTQPLRNGHASGVACAEVIAPVVHTLKVNTGNKMPSFTMEASLRGAETAGNVRRKFNGCYINTMELSCEEEGELHANLGLIAMNTTAADTTITTVTIPTTAPYMYDEGVITLHGGVIATVKSFKVTVNNNLTANRYIQATTGLNPDEVVESLRTIEIQCTAVPQDKTWTELMRPGAQSATSLSAKFSRSASDYIDIQATGVYMTDASQPFPEEGEIVTEMTLIAKTCVIETKDSTEYYLMV